MEQCDKKGVSQNISKIWDNGGRGMREILFRGKRVDNGEWIEGDLIQSRDKTYIHPKANSFRVSETGLSKLIVLREVYPETVGQYTGLTDKNGKKIFEGDIIRSNSERGYIEYYPNDCAFDVVDDHGFYWLISEMSNIEVIGNIHDNPELLEEK
jgi:hypothetical protein